MYKLDFDQNPTHTDPDAPLTPGAYRDAMQSVENYFRGAALDCLLGGARLEDAAKMILLASEAETLKNDPVPENGMFEITKGRVRDLRDGDTRAERAGDFVLVQNAFIGSLEAIGNQSLMQVCQVFADDLALTETCDNVDLPAALESALAGKHLAPYSRDADALVFTDADLDEYAGLLGDGCAGLDPEQRHEAAAAAVREWSDGHAMDGFADFLSDYRFEPVNGAMRSAGIKR